MRSKISALGVKLLPKNLYSRLTLITLATVITWYVIIYAYTNILPAEYAANAPLTSTLMWKIIGNINDLDTRLSSWGPAWEATMSSSFSAPTGGNTVITGFTINTPITVGEWFDPVTGIFQPTVAGRYLFTIYGYSGTQWNWTAGIIKNGAIWIYGGAVAVSWNGNIANTSYVANLNGSSDYVNFKITNYSWVTTILTSIKVTWTKLP